MKGLTLLLALICVSCRSGERLVPSGEFHAVAHKGSGEVQVWRRLDGARYLRVWDLKTHPAPNLELCLVRAADARDNETVLAGGFVCLGPVASRGSYPVPPAIDFSHYRSVTVWSRSYEVNFTTAPLFPAPDASAEP